MRRSSKRLKSRRVSKRAWQQVTRIGELCHTHVSYKWLYHLDASVESVLTPHDHTTIVQQRLGNSARTGFGECLLCGSFLDPQLEHGETCSAAEATRRHHAGLHAVVCGLKLAHPGITTERRGLTASQSRLVDIFTTAAVPRRSAHLDVCVASPNAAAARGDAAQASYDRKLSTRPFTIDLLSGQETGDHKLPSLEPCSMQQT